MDSIVGIGAIGRFVTRGAILIGIVVALSLHFAGPVAAYTTQAMTNVRGPDEIEQTIEYHLNAAELNHTTDQSWQILTAGWRASMASDADGVAVSLVKTVDADAFRKGATFDYGQVSKSPLPSLVFVVDEGPLERKYHLQISFLEAAVPGMGGYSWKITLPGRVTETNADRREGEAAVFTLGGNNTSTMRVLTVNSQESKIHNSALAGLILLVLAFGGGVYATRRTRGNAYAFPQPAGEDVTATQIVCTTCRTTNPLSARFCTTCGTVLAVTPTELRCAHCASVSLPGARFCRTCGRAP